MAAGRLAAGALFRRLPPKRGIPLLERDSDRWSSSGAIRTASPELKDDAVGGEGPTLDAPPWSLSTSKSSAELFGEADEKSLGPPDVTEAIDVLVLNHFADELRAALAEPGERFVDVAYSEHDA